MCKWDKFILTLSLSYIPKVGHRILLCTSTKILVCLNGHFHIFSYALQSFLYISSMLWAFTNLSNYTYIMFHFWVRFRKERTKESRKHVVYYVAFLGHTPLKRDKKKTKPVVYIISILWSLLAKWKKQNKNKLHLCHVLLQVAYFSWFIERYRSRFEQGIEHLILYWNK